MELGNDDIYLVKYKNVGMSDQYIAQKLGMSLEEVQLRWKRIVESAQASVDSQAGLAAQLNVAALQYQLLGESFKILTNALGNSMSPTEIRNLIDPDPEKTVQNLIKSCIILRPFVPIDPVKSLEEHQRKN